jgi:hypothetical protein
MSLVSELPPEPLDGYIGDDPIRWTVDLSGFVLRCSSVQRHR